MTSRTTRIWMWTEACARLEQADNLQRAFFRPAGQRAAGPVWEPPADVLESATELRLVIALPGVAETDVAIAERPDGVVVAGVRRFPGSADGELAIRSLEIPYGRFERWIEIPMARVELVERVLLHGCLHLRFLKRPGVPR